MNTDTTKIASTPTGTTPPTTDALIGAIQQSLLGSSGMVSSEDTNLETLVNSAVKSTQDANTANKNQIATTYNQKEDAARSDQSSQINQQLESGAGIGINIGALRQLTLTTDKNIRDLEEQKQALMMQGDAEATKAITDLQVKAYQFQSDAIQKTFTNLISLGSLMVANKNADNKSPNTQVVEANGRKILVDSGTGATIKDLGAATSGSTQTEAQAKQSQITAITNFFSAGKTVPNTNRGDGKPVSSLDANNQPTPEAWKYAIAHSGLDRQSFIQEFGSQIVNDSSGDVSSKYGLTPKEIALIKG